MIKLRDLIKENPDVVKDGDRTLARSNDSDAYTFGYTASGFKLTFHIEPTQKQMSSNYHEDMFGSRHNAIFSGRLWKDKQIISLWGKYPDKKQLMKLVKDISKYLKTPIDMYSWRIEVPISGDEMPDNVGRNVPVQGTMKSKLIPIASYKNSSSIEFDSKPVHSMTPNEKEEFKQKELAKADTPEKKKEIQQKFQVPAGVGSNSLKYKNKQNFNRTVGLDETT